MDSRSWHSDPSFRPLDADQQTENMENCLVDLSDDHSPSAASNPSVSKEGSASRSSYKRASHSGIALTDHQILSNSTHSMKDLYYRSSPSRRDLTSSGRKKSLWSIKDIDEEMAKKDKTIFRQRVQLEVYERRELENSSMDDEEHRSLLQKNLALEVRAQELERDLQIAQEEAESIRQHYHENYAKAVEKASTDGYAKACLERAERLHVDVTTSPLHKSEEMSDSLAIPMELDEDSRVAELEEVRQLGYNQAMDEIARTAPVTDERDAAEQIALQTQLIEEARQQGYMKAVEDLKLDAVDLTKPKFVDIGTNPVIRTPATRGEESMLNLTEYADFPANKRLGASSAMSPFRRTLLADGELNRSSSASGIKSISKLEQATFSMLITRLQELVEFLTRGLNGSFDSSMNATNVSLLEMTMANMSIMPEVGSGDGSPASFCLATKLQELIEISREISFHDAEVETDQQWMFLQDQNRELIAKIEVYEKAALGIQKVSEDNGRLSEKVVFAEEKFGAQIEMLQAEISRLTGDLEDATEAKDEYEKELSGLAGHIATLENQMGQNRDSYEFLLKNAVRRPDCDAETSTDIGMADLEREVHQLQQRLQEMTTTVQTQSDQLITLSAVKENLEKRLDDIGTVMNDYEQAVREKQDLENHLYDVQNQLTATTDSLSCEKQEMAGCRQRLMDAESQIVLAGEELARVRVDTEHQIEQRDRDIYVLQSEISALNSVRSELETKLGSSIDQFEKTESRLAELRDAMRRSEYRRDELERFIDRPRTSATQQTELNWSNVKAEKVALSETIEKLTAEVEALESEMHRVEEDGMNDLRDAHEALASKDEDLRNVEERIQTLAKTVEEVLDEKDFLEQKTADMEERLDELEKQLSTSEQERLELLSNLENIRKREVKLDKWEKAVKKEVTRTNDVLKQANINLSRRTVAASVQPQHPLKDRAPTQSRTRES